MSLCGLSERHGGLQNQGPRLLNAGSIQGEPLPCLPLQGWHLVCKLNIHGTVHWGWKALTAYVLAVSPAPHLPRQGRPLCLEGEAD